MSSPSPLPLRIFDGDESGRFQVKQVERLEVERLEVERGRRAGARGDRQRLSPAAHQAARADKGVEAFGMRSSEASPCPAIGFRR